MEVEFVLTQKSSEGAKLERKVRDMGLSLYGFVDMLLYLHGKGRMTWNADWERTEDEKKISKALESVAAEVGAKNITSGM